MFGGQQSAAAVQGFAQEPCATPLELEPVLELELVLLDVLVLVDPVVPELDVVEALVPPAPLDDELDDVEEEPPVPLLPHATTVAVAASINSGRPPIWRAFIR